MLIPVRCFTCGKVLADKYDWYIRQVEALKSKPEPEKEKGKEKEAPYFDAVMSGGILDKMGLSRYCCRRHMLATVDMMDTI
jgi:DNA-directed RNA polymerase subunit N (RpoN/RPB10)